MPAILDTALDGMDPAAVQEFGVITGALAALVMFAADAYILYKIDLHMGWIVNLVVCYVVLYPMLKLNGKAFDLVQSWNEREYDDWTRHNPQPVRGVLVARGRARRAASS